MIIITKSMIIIMSSHEITIMSHDSVATKTNGNDETEYISDGRYSERESYVDK